MPRKYLTRYLNENGITYQQYLASEHWQDVRRRYWASKLHDRTCYACGKTGALEVHHKTYKRIGHERLHDLCLLCRECHQSTHFVEKNRKKGGLWGAAKRVKKNLEQTGDRLKMIKGHRIFEIGVAYCNYRFFNGQQCLNRAVANGYCNGPHKR